MTKSILQLLEELDNEVQLAPWTTVKKDLGGSTDRIRDDNGFTVIETTDLDSTAEFICLMRNHIKDLIVVARAAQPIVRNIERLQKKSNLIVCLEDALALQKALAKLEADNE